MEQFKKTQVVMLPTEKGKIYKFDNKLSLEENSWYKITSKTNTSNELYFLSDDKVKEGDWWLRLIDNEIGKANQSIDNPNTIKTHKKIIATTDTSLKIAKKRASGQRYIFGLSNDDGLIYISLPQPSQQFIENWIEYYNAGIIITEVLVEYEMYSDIYDTSWKEEGYSGGIAPRKQRLKVNPDNTINIKERKDSYTKEEVELLLVKLAEFIIYSKDNKDLIDNWINENL